MEEVKNWPPYLDCPKHEGAPERSYKEGGWEDKYYLAKRDLPQCKFNNCDDVDCRGCNNLFPVDPNAVYFVLRLDTDPHARRAAFAYARSVQQDNSQFAWDIRNKVLDLFKNYVRRREVN